MSDRPILVLAGAGDGLGVSLAGCFAAAGYDIVGLSRTGRAAAALEQAARSKGGAYDERRCDLNQRDEIERALAPDLDRVAVAIHNAQHLLIKPFVETGAAEFEQTWRTAAFGAFQLAQVVVPPMLERKAGTLLFSGATAGMRGGAKFSAFASAKFALRGFAQALSRELGGQGIHVAHIVIDGLIDGEKSDRRFGPAQGMRMNPDAVARAYLDLALQHPSAWTHELDLRPCTERY